MAKPSSSSPSAARHEAGAGSTPLWSSTSSSRGVLCPPLPLPALPSPPSRADDGAGDSDDGDLGGVLSRAAGWSEPGTCGSPGSGSGDQTDLTSSEQSSADVPDSPCVSSASPAALPGSPVLSRPGRVLLVLSAVLGSDHSDRSESLLPSAASARPTYSLAFAGPGGGGEPRAGTAFRGAPSACEPPAAALSASTHQATSTLSVVWSSKARWRVLRMKPPHVWGLPLGNSLPTPLAGCGRHGSRSAPRMSLKWIGCDTSL
mmetsp:Transcript_52891/g.148987  ORF Transcript_52891/g.148987 Transcript_52891/m.148987 type:complete len:260 (-) Transcript_52891:271-1050(-)